MKAAFFGMALTATLAGCDSLASPLPLAMAVVTGGIIPCSGLPPSVASNLPHYSAGGVTVLKGDLVVRGSDGGYLPSSEVAHQPVGTNETYRFTLRPGGYVLVADFPPPANVHPHMAISLHAGELLRTDIPNECK